MTANRFGQRPSALLASEVDRLSEIDALDFDFACNLRLTVYDNEREFDRLRAYKREFKNALSEWFNNLPDSLDATGNAPIDGDDDDVL